VMHPIGGNPLAGGPLLPDHPRQSETALLS
jgi:hypothetical protein